VNRVLVHGATGFTGRLVCAALRRRGIAHAVSGRSAERLATLDTDERVVVDLRDEGSIERAVGGRTLVCACAGPFAEVGEPVIAACARLGVHYVDTTGEQTFVARAIDRCHAAARGSGACCVPAMAYEIAPSDWGAHLAAEAVGGSPDVLELAYSVRGAAATRGTKKSAIGLLADARSRQWVGGELVDERAAARVRTFEVDATGKTVRAVSFPSPEALVVPAHTGAREVRTYMAVGSAASFALHWGRALVPTAMRVARGALERGIDRGAEGPTEAERAATRFAVVCEARKGDRRATVRVTGADPYGLTAEIQAWAAERALAGRVQASGVVAPSVAFDPREAFAELKRFGVEVDVSKT
jgi:short subunit dehydrogenase-like uncharacterized protein